MRNSEEEREKGRERDLSKSLSVWGFNAWITFCLCALLQEGYVELKPFTVSTIQSCCSCKFEYIKIK